MVYSYNLGTRFYEIAQKSKTKIALKYPNGTSFLYGELDILSNQWGHFLKGKKIKKGDIIAIFNEKSYLAYSLMLACLKIGVVYTNLDISSPWPRLEKIINRCKPSAIFFDSNDNIIEDELRRYCQGIDSFRINDSRFESDLLSLDKDSLVDTLSIHGGDPAYIMFTSGSTGFPKGAVMSHNNLLNFIQWGKQTFQVSENDIFTNANPIYFDNSVFDFYVSLFNSATLVPLSQDLVKNAQQLVQAINDSQCTIWFSVPSLLVYLLTTKSLSKKDFEHISRISFGGEGFPKNKLKQLFNLYSDRITLYNVYGPTECTCICSSHIITDSDFVNMNELASLGKIAPNFGYEIIPLEDDNNNFGELCLVGPCVGLGYYDDPERTSQSFIQNPNKRFNQIMYKTGDLVERSENGNLFFRGRLDNQIKHMGYRIELEEVEAAFSTLNYVNEVGVVYEKVTEDFGQIKAYVSINSEYKDSTLILGDIRKLLPPYMVPKVVRILDSLPKNSNGKIDRKQLAKIRYE
jgi:D-alanine--poly(phosphoribitol) ligase subunit 1